MTCRSDDAEVYYRDRDPIERELDDEWRDNTYAGLSEWTTDEALLSFVRTIMGSER